MDFLASLWNVVVVFFGAAIFLAALVAFFTVVTNVMRDRSARVRVDSAGRKWDVPRCRLVIPAG